MSDMMTFPDTVEEFMENYKIVDSEQIYTNGIAMVPIFRMKQWFEHLPSAQPKTGKWKPYDVPWYQCSVCGAVREQKAFMENFCPNCGADMRGEENDS